MMVIAKVLEFGKEPQTEINTEGFDGNVSVSLNEQFLDKKLRLLLLAESTGAEVRKLVEEKSYVLEVYMTGGPFDLIMQVVGSTPAELSVIRDDIGNIPGIHNLLGLFIYSTEPIVKYPGKGIQALVLVEARNGASLDVLQRVLQLEGIYEGAAVSGPYDLYFKVSVPTAQELGKRILADIQSDNGVISTLTCFLISTV